MTTTTARAGRTKAKAAIATLSLVAAALGGLAPAVTPAAAVAGAWSPTGSLGSARELATANLLGDGTVLVAGGAGLDADRAYRTRSSAEIYRPATGAWSPTAGPMRDARHGHTATRLLDGKILLVGGGADDVNALSLASAEIYDPVAGTFSPTGSLNVGRYGHTATLMTDGSVFVVGGNAKAHQFGVELGSAELWTPATGTWRLINNRTWVPIPRVNNQATRLLDGNVLLTGNQPDYRPAAEIYHPDNELFFFTGSMFGSRRRHTATLLMNGKVLVQGGADETAPSTGAQPGPEVFDPEGEFFLLVGSLAHPSRHASTATLLLDGKVIVAGGTGVTEAQASPVTELYNPAAMTWSQVGAMAGTRWNHTATLLRNGKVLVVGGARAGGKTLKSAELYDPGPQPARIVSMALSGHLRATGTVGGAKPCRGGITVNILRNGVVRGTTTTGPDGTYALDLTDSVGTYQAVVKASMWEDIPCNKASSATENHLH